MCGFAGVFEPRGTKASASERSRLLEAMGRQLARRGPDDEQLYLSDTLSLVFRRLSIVNVQGGRQPIWNEDRSLMVVVNGEIYNHLELRSRLRTPHHFTTASDSEVFLHLYEERGPEALDELIGMFSIALWDVRKQSLFLARDRLGIKPLYCAKVGSTFLFGSELKALLVHPDCPRRPDFMDAERARERLVSHVQGVAQLPGGTWLRLEGEQETERRYWSLETAIAERPAPDTASDTEIIEQYGSLLRDSVHRRLMADVPIGAFLSGGVDSAALVAIAAEKVPLHCFTIVEENTVRVGDVDAAVKVARRLQLPLHPVVFDSDWLRRAGWSLQTFEYFVWLMDSPVFDPEWLMKHELHRWVKTRFPDMKVMLLGQGADEFAGGYSNPYDAPSRSWRQFLSNQQPGPDSPDRMLPAHLREVHVSANEADPFTRRMRGSLLTLQNHNLWHEDRTSSGQGIEARVPFLDHRLVELLARIPPAQHERLFFDKLIVRKAASRWLTPEEANRPKVRFFLGPAPASIEKMLRVAVQCSWQDFEASYLRVPGSSWNADAISELFSNVQRGSHPGPLLSVMAAMIFERLCLTQGGEKPPPGLDPPSSLRELSETWGPAPTSETWSETARPRLHPELRVYGPLSGARTELLLLLEDQVTSVGADEGVKVELVKLLCGSSGLTVGNIAAIFGVTLERIAAVLTDLEESGIFALAAPAE